MGPIHIFRRRWKGHIANGIASSQLTFRLQVLSHLLCMAVAMSVEFSRPSLYCLESDPPVYRSGVDLFKSQSLGFVSLGTFRPRTYFLWRNRGLMSVIQRMKLLPSLGASCQEFPTLFVSKSQPLGLGKMFNLPTFHNV